METRLSQFERIMLCKVLLEQPEADLLRWSQMAVTAVRGLQEKGMIGGLDFDLRPSKKGYKELGFDPDQVLAEPVLISHQQLSH